MVWIFYHQLLSVKMIEKKMTTLTGDIKIWLGWSWGSTLNFLCYSYLYHYWFEIHRLSIERYNFWLKSNEILTSEHQPLKLKVHILWFLNVVLLKEAQRFLLKFEIQYLSKFSVSQFAAKVTRVRLDR